MQDIFIFAFKKPFDITNYFSHCMAMNTKWGEMLLTHFTD